MERITSRQNPLLQRVRKLQSSKSFRGECGEYVGDGVKLLEEAIRWQAGLQTVIVSEGLSFPALSDAVRQVTVPPDVMRSISQMQTPQGVLFVCALPLSPPPPSMAGCVVLDGIQDPGNLGTMLRTADALEVPLVLTGDCADAYGPKTVRASMGAVFRRPVWSCGLDRLCALAEASGLPVYGAALRADTVDVRAVSLRRSVVLVGSEGRGLSPQALAACGRTVRIPMGERCESLNAAAAAAVLLWEGWR